MSSPDTAKTENLEAELVIVGGGGAGLSAATAAAEGGAGNIIVLEKGALGGNSALATGLFAVESPAQKRAAIDTSADVVFKQAMDFAHWQSNPWLVRAFIDKSGDTIRWLEDKGVYFECIPLYYGQDPLVWHVPDGQPGFGRAALIIKALTKECRQRGVQFLTKTPAKKLLVGNKGSITVLAASNKRRLNITTRCVIIASGGFAGNIELLKQCYPEYREGMRGGGIAHNRGDGLLMAVEIGATTEGLREEGVPTTGVPDDENQTGEGAAAKVAAVHGGPKIRIGSPPNVVEVSTVAIMREPYVVGVNEKGKRFFDESTSAQHRRVSSDAVKARHLLFDQSIVNHMTEYGLTTGEGRYRVGQRGKLPGLAEGLKTQADEGLLKMADSWDEIAEYIDVEPAVLKATIDKYNADCDRGRDSFLVKDPKFLIPLRTPPYYAITSPIGMGILDTMLGGIKINEHTEVLDKQDNPIPGLYAAGLVAGGWQAISYDGLHMSGAALGFALISGRIAGENAAEFLRG